MNSVNCGKRFLSQKEKCEIVMFSVHLGVSDDDISKYFNITKEGISGLVGEYLRHVRATGQQMQLRGIINGGKRIEERVITRKLGRPLDENSKKQIILGHLDKGLKSKEIV